ncbi:PIG-L family deacetylase [Candidatus Parcubacteria bacterium]|nr:MAG: PIG-L family deacetylase [Candidatus Parcubacteria bacterium]
MRKNTILCVFAHPDDETFGPGGTIALLARHHDVWIASATRGNAGKDSRAQKTGSLAAARPRELRAAAKILGARGVVFFDFRDGELSNATYHALARRIEGLVRRLKPHTLLTYEPLGVSGHLDHIAVALAARFVYERQPRIKRLLAYCVSTPRANAMRKGYFIWVPPGYERGTMGLTVPTAGMGDVKLKAMLAHRSQRHDIERILTRARQFPEEESFLVQTRPGAPALHLPRA